MLFARSLWCERLHVRFDVVAVYTHSNLCYASSFHLFLVTCASATETTVLYSFRFVSAHGNVLDARTHSRTQRTQSTAHCWIVWFGASPLAGWNRFTAQRNANACSVYSSRHLRACVCVYARASVCVSVGLLLVVNIMPRALVLPSFIRSTHFVVILCIDRHHHRCARAVGQRELFRFRVDVSLRSVVDGVLTVVQVSVSLCEDETKIKSQFLSGDSRISRAE